MSTYVDLMRLNFPDQEEERRKWLSAMKQRLSGERREKAEHFRRQEDQERSLGAGVLLDYALMRSGRREKTETVRISEHGKPEFLSSPGLFFNLSHSGDYVLSVISDRTCGCDVETVRTAAAGVAERFFCERERREIFSCPEGKMRDEIFTRFWTMKESYVKMTGTGLTVPLDSFCILLPSEKENLPGRVFQDGRQENCAIYEFSGLTGAGVSVCLSSDDRDVFFSFQKLSDVI